MKKIFVFVVAILVGVVNASTLYVEGILRGVNGELGANQVCYTSSLIVIDNSNSTTKLYPFIIDTDNEGYFSAYINNVDLSNDSANYSYKLKTVDYGTLNIRGLLVDAPYSIYSKVAKRNIPNGRSFSGINNLTIENLEVKSLNASGADFVVSGNLELNSLPSNIGDLFIKDVRFSDSSSLAILTGNTAGMSMKYDDFKEDSGCALYCDSNGSASFKITAKADGLLFVIARSDHSGGDSKFRLTVTVGDYKICDSKEVRTNTDDSNIESPVITYPVRKGETIEVYGKCSKSGLYWRKGWAKAKVLYFGN